MTDTQHPPASAARSEWSAMTEALLRTTFECAPIGMALADTQGHFITVNPALERMLGYCRGDLVGCDLAGFVHVDERPQLPALYSELRAGRQVDQIELRFLRKDEMVLWGELTVSMADSTGETPVVIVMVEDITERKRAEEGAYGTDDEFRSIFVSTTDGLVIRTMDGTIVEANPAMCRMHGYSRSEFLALPVDALVHPEYRSQLAACLKAVKAGGEFRGERVDLRKDGTAFPVEVHDTRFSYRDAPHILAVVCDVSERKRAEERVREKEVQYQSIFEATSDGLTIIDPDTGTVAEVNPAFCRMIGYTRDELVGEDARVFIHPDSHDLFAGYLDVVTAGGTFHARTTEVRKDGSLMPVEVNGASFLYNGKRHGLSVVRDITEQVAAYEHLEQRVEERTRELSALLEVSRHVSSTLELPQLLGTILDELKQVVDYMDATILEIADDEFIHLDYRGPMTMSDIAPIRVPVQTAPFWDRLGQGESVIVPDLWADTPDTAVYWQALGEGSREHFAHFRCWLGVPVMLQDRAIGLMVLIHDQPGYYTPHHAGLAVAIAQHAAYAIENARLYKRAQQLAASEERARLARELHDSVTQALFSMTMHTRVAELAMEDEGIRPDGAVAENLRQLSELAQGGLAEMRSLIFELRPGALQEEGLVAALHKHCRALTAREGLPIDLEAPSERIPLDPAIEEHLYRLTQEALHNVVKHAAAGRVLIQLRDKDGLLVLEITDDGMGFDMTTVPPGHLGLETMATRARAMGAEMTMRSQPGQGTTIRVAMRRVGEGDPHD